MYSRASHGCLSIPPGARAILFILDNNLIANTMFAISIRVQSFHLECIHRPVFDRKWGGLFIILGDGHIEMMINHVQVDNCLIFDFQGVGFQSFIRSVIRVCR